MLIETKNNFDILRLILAILVFCAHWNILTNQNISNEVWYVQHNLNKYPSVVITNINGNVVEGEITYTNKNNLEINFSAPFRGYADLN